MKPLLLFLFLFLTSTSFTEAQTLPKKISGKVIYVVDGDTFDLLTSDTVKIRIRLNAIDCPERKQDYYQICKDALGRYIFGKNVLIINLGRDRWKRMIADVYVDNESINYKMVKNGFAWHFKKYSTDQKLAAAEEDARKNKIGLWKTVNPTAPWMYRKLPKKSPEKLN